MTRILKKDREQALRRELDRQGLRLRRTPCIWSKTREPIHQLIDDDGRAIETLTPGEYDRMLFEALPAQ